MAQGIKPTGGTQIECTFVRCVFPTLKTRVETFERRGFDGYGFVTEAKGDADFPIVLEFFGDEPTVQTWIENIEALQGVICEVENGFGNIVGGILVEKVGQPEKKVALRHDADDPNGDGFKGMIQIQAKRLV